MIDIQVSNIDDNSYLNADQILQLEVFAYALCDELKITGKVISIVLTDSELVSKLNKLYRKKSETTDVLSFPLNTIDSEDPLLGEIIIDVDRALSQANEYGHSLIKEIAFLIMHGFLHLIGYDHDDIHQGEMRQKEKELVEKFSILQ